MMKRHGCQNFPLHDRARLEGEWTMNAELRIYDDIRSQVDTDFAM